MNNVCLNVVNPQQCVKYEKPTSENKFFSRQDTDGKNVDSKIHFPSQ